MCILAGFTSCNTSPCKWMASFASACSAGHPWVSKDGVAPDKPLDSMVLSRMKKFSAMNKLKKMALRVSGTGSLCLWCFKHQMSFRRRVTFR